MRANDVVDLILTGACLLGLAMGMGLRGSGGNVNPPPPPGSRRPPASPPPPPRKKPQ